jgi:Gluconate 2-dehydrogenase subunit 3
VDAYSFFHDDQYVLNYCAKHLARLNTDRRHTYGPPGEQAPRDRIAEAWRFPIVDTYGGGAPAAASADSFDDYNSVTFIYAGADIQSPASVGVIGTFATLYDPIPLRQVLWEGEPTRYWSVSYAVLTGQKHLYRFIVDGAFPVNDPVNPQEEMMDNGAVWSRFFTNNFSSPVVTERWELDILYRLAAEILPFQTGDASNFLARFYDYLDRATQDSVYANAYRMDDSVGEVNFVDNMLAREEHHHLVDYKTCLRIIDRVLRQRNPYTEPARMSRNVYFGLYNDMASNNVPEWDYGAYSSPQYFLYLLRRHVLTGAFCHPKYGGNAGAAGWAYLTERFHLPSPEPGKAGQTLFDWPRAIEKPLGVNADYLG